MLKRIFDFLFAITGLFISLPFWFILSLAIWMEDGQGVFYAQERVGKDGRIFKSWKFRSMIPGAEDGLGPVPAQSNDLRITKIGRLMRKTAMDELPQLISILTDVHHNFVEQYKWLFDQDGVELEFDKDSLDLIADRTLKTKTGARGLHSELERVLLPHMFDLPRYRKQEILQVTINKTQVNTPMTLIQENA